MSIYEMYVCVSILLTPILTKLTCSRAVDLFFIVFRSQPQQMTQQVGAAVSHQQLGQTRWPSPRRTIKLFCVADRQQQEQLQPPAEGRNEWTTSAQHKRSKRSRKAELMGVAKALADLASTSDTCTDDVMRLLNDKLQSLSSLANSAGLVAPTDVVVANPAVTADKET
jgi:hypothetical protein